MNVEIGADATEDDDGRGAPRSGQRGEQLDDLAANEIGCGRIQLQRASARQKIALNGPGIRRMSDNILNLISKSKIERSKSPFYPANAG